jgi:peptide/nickel transport system ATP-binding protein/oligopeptide transport system ATP-binding protein
MRLIQSPPGKIVAGQALLRGEDLLRLSAKEMRALRGGKIAMIFQEPMTALNPVFTIGSQIMESPRIHRGLSRRQAREAAVGMLEKVGIPMPEKRVDDYPHQLSGGMRQRAMIAIALCCGPELLICDEPTTALDVTIQAQILELINDLKKELNTSVLMITHDLGVVAQVSENVLVMYAGKAMEYGPVRDVFTDPRHPYTRALLESIPMVGMARGEGRARGRLRTIEGMVPSLSKRPQGCLFHPRCQSPMDICRARRPGLTTGGDGRQVRCWLYGDKGEESDEAQEA